MSNLILYKIKNKKKLIPQADNLNYIYDIFLSTGLCPITYDTIQFIADELNTPRQWHYYSSALFFLDLLEKWKYNSNIILVLTNEGQKLLDKKSKKEFFLYVKNKLISYKLYSLNSFEIYNNITKIQQLSPTTLERRRFSIQKWIKTIEEFEKNSFNFISS